MSSGAGGMMDIDFGWVMLQVVVVFIIVVIIGFSIAIMIYRGQKVALFDGLWKTIQSNGKKDEW